MTFASALRRAISINSTATVAITTAAIAIITNRIFIFIIITINVTIIIINSTIIQDRGTTNALLHRTRTRIRRCVHGGRTFSEVLPL